VNCYAKRDRWGNFEKYPKIWLLWATHSSVARHRARDSCGPLTTLARAHTRWRQRTRSTNTKEFVCVCELYWRKKSVLFINLIAKTAHSHTGRVHTHRRTRTPTPTRRQKSLKTESVINGVSFPNAKWIFLETVPRDGKKWRPQPEQQLDFLFGLYSVVRPRLVVGERMRWFFVDFVAVRYPPEEKYKKCLKRTPKRLNLLCIFRTIEHTAAKKIPLPISTYYYY